MAQDETNFDIAVIGAGAAGLSAAYFLAPHARVAVLEGEAHPAYHSSGRSAAMYIEGFENLVVQELTRASAGLFFSPPPGFYEHPLVHPVGGLTAAGPAESDALKQYLKTWQPTCPELVSIGPAEAMAMVPILRNNWVTGAAYDPSWHSIDVHGLLTGYQRGIKANGGSVQTNTAVTAMQRANGTWTLTTTSGTLGAELVVNATGAWANQVAALAGIPALPLAPLRRTVTILPTPGNMGNWPLVHTISEDLYFKPENPGLLISPQDETPSQPMDAHALELDIARAVERFQQITEYRVQRITRSWAGLRTFAPDRHPVVGFDAGVEGFFWLAGLGGLGIQTSPGLGQLTAQIILGETVPDRRIAAARFTD